MISLIYSSHLILKSFQHKIRGIAHCFLFVLHLCITASIQSQSFYPEITNYSFGSSQNWSIDVCSNEILAVANNSGLSIFDGQAWSMLQLPKNMIIRSVLCYKDKIFTGSYEEFGYWKKNELGDFEYTSLKDKFDKTSPVPSEEFWEIINYGESIFFRSFGSIYEYDGQSIRTITNSYNVSSLNIYKDELLFGSFSDGIARINDHKVESFTSNKTLSDLSSVSILSSHNDFIFAYDLNLGGFLFQGDRQFILPSSLQNDLRDFALNKVEFIDTNTIAFGTVKNGVLIYTIATQNYQIINRQSGIKNNTVLDIKYKNDLLWLALDDGISKIDINSAYTFYNDNSGTLGTVYDVAFFNGKYFLASNTGVYTFSSNELKLLSNSEGHCWEILKYENTLLFGHNRGAFQLDPDEESLSIIPGSFSGVYNFLPIPKSNKLLVSTYSGIGVLVNDTSDISISKLSGIDAPVDKLIFENDSTLWATDNYKGLYKINFDSARLEVLDVLRLSDNPIINDNKVEFESIDDELYFKIDRNWYTFSQADQSFEVFNKLQDYTILGSKEKSIWVLDESNSSIINFDESFNVKQQLINKNLVSKFVEDHQKIIFQNDSTSLFNIKDGFALLHQHKIKPQKKIKPQIRRIYTNGKPYDKLGSEKKITLNHLQAKSVSFKVNIPGKYDRELSYTLKGDLNLTDDIRDGFFTLRNLPKGEYVLEIFEKGNSSSSTLIDLTILPPWYFGIWMKLFYVFTVIIILYLIEVYRQKQARRAHLNNQKKMIEKAQKQIALVEKNNLINEINSKKKELTNRTATIVKKNEAIILLRNELRRLEKNSPNIARTKNVLLRSGKQLDSKNDWQLFESKFNELNEDFFDGLSEKFPKLTTKDRKLCAYIKVGLTSKEIAPLLDITTRSVELRRYRLRKKLNMGANITFNEFFRQF